MKSASSSTMVCPPDEEWFIKTSHGKLLHLISGESPGSDKEPCLRLHRGRSATGFAGIGGLTDGRNSKHGMCLSYTVRLISPVRLIRIHKEDLFSGISVPDVIQRRIRLVMEESLTKELSNIRSPISTTREKAILEQLREKIATDLLSAGLELTDLQPEGSGIRKERAQ